MFLMIFCSNSVRLSKIQLVGDGPTDGRTDGRTDGPTDGHSLLKRCDGASKNQSSLRIIILPYRFVVEKVFLFFSCVIILRFSLVAGTRECHLNFLLKPFLTCTFKGIAQNQIHLACLQAQKLNFFKWAFLFRCTITSL